jgi:hypothetical protein
MGLIESIVSALITVLYLPLYPFVVGLNLLYSWIAGLIGPYSGIITSVIDVLASVQGVIADVFEFVLPTAWFGLLIVVIALNVGLRIYYFVKSVNIFGFSL